LALSFCCVNGQICVSYLAHHSKQESLNINIYIKGIVKPVHNSHLGDPNIAAVVDWWPCSDIFINYKQGKMTSK